MTAVCFKRAVGWCKTKAKATFAYHPRAERMKIEPYRSFCKALRFADTLHSAVHMAFACHAHILSGCFYGNLSGTAEF